MTTNLKIQHVAAGLRIFSIQPPAKADDILAAVILKLGEENYQLATTEQRFNDATEKWETYSWGIQYRYTEREAWIAALDHLGILPSESPEGWGVAG